MTPKSYTLYVKSKTDGTCVSQSAQPVTINAVPDAPTEPTAGTVTQPTCGTPTGTIEITAQTGVEYSIDGTTYQASNTFAGLTPKSYTLYVKSKTDGTCVNSL